MHTETMKIISILTLFNVLYVHCEGSNMRFLDQLNNFRREVREDLNNIQTNISNLFDTVNELQKPETSDREDPHDNKMVSEYGGNCAVDCREVRDEIMRVNSTILEALESEKRLNRQLQNKVEALEADNRKNRRLRNKLQTFEDALSDIAENIDVFTSFMAYVNDTLQIPVTVRPTDNLDYPDLISSYEYLDSIEDTTTTTATTTTTSTTTATTTAATTSSSTETNSFKETKPKRKTPEPSYCRRAKRSGVFGIYLKSIKEERSVYCDVETDGGGWTVIMRRQDGSVDFDRNWDEYKNGFGNIEGDFWIGNDLIHILTNSNSMELRIDMEDYDGEKAFAKYSYFEIGSEAENYILNVGGYSGTAGDGLVNVSNPGGVLNGMLFSTRDRDQDLYDYTSCAELYPGGWWYNRCFRSHLTGIYGDMADVKVHQGILWYSWTKWNRYLKYVDMKIR